MYLRIIGFAGLGLILFCAGCGDLTPPDRKPVSPAGIAPTGGLDEMSQPVKTSPRPAAPAKQAVPDASGTPAAPSKPADTPAVPGA